MSTKRKAAPKKVAAPDPKRQYVALGLDEFGNIQNTCMFDTGFNAAQNYRDDFCNENPWLVVEINPSWIRSKGQEPAPTSGKSVKLA